MNKMNKNQEEAVTWVDGPCLVLAGPGSGKTFVLVNRILRLVRLGIDPESILIITFTRAAAMEMKERFHKLLLDENVSISSEPTFGTFHSVFYEILKNDFGYSSDSLLDEGEEKKIVFSVIEKRDDVRVSLDTVDNIISDIAAYKLACEKQETFTPKYLSESVFFDIYDRYKERLYNEKRLDFYDMIAKCGELLSKHKDTLSYYRERYKYFLIDEFQDINKSQYDIINLMCENSNLFVVGDDDQSIYKFRGSSPRVMKDFLSDYKGAQIIRLNENYRCAKVIVKHSKRVIDNNADRFKKDLVAKRDDIGFLQIKAFDDSLSENEFIIEEIRKLNAIGIKNSEIAILYRTNLLSSAISKVLSKYNIPYVIKGEVNNIYDHFAIKDIIAYLMISIGDNASENYMRIANKPLRYISRDAIGFKETSIDSLIEYYKDSDYILKFLSKFRHDIHMIHGLITPLAIRYIRKDVGYDDYLKKYCREKSIDYEDIIELLDSFEDEAVGHNDISDFLSYIKDSEKSNDKSSYDSISLMTFHLSKGLEYKAVFIADANDLIIPHKKSIKENDIETERRLFYVAMTRAKDYLYILFTKRRFGKNYRASRFILEAVGGQNGEKT